MKTLIAYFLVMLLWSLSGFIAAATLAVVMPIIGLLWLPISMLIFRRGLSSSAMRAWNNLWIVFYLLIGGAIGYLLVWSSITIFAWLNITPSIVLIFVLICSMLIQLGMYFRLPAEGSQKQLNLYAQVIGSAIGVALAGGAFGFY